MGGTAKRRTLNAAPLERRLAKTEIKWATIVREEANAGRARGDRGERTD